MEKNHVAVPEKRRQLNVNMKTTGVTGAEATSKYGDCRNRNTVR